MYVLLSISHCSVRFEYPLRFLFCLPINGLLVAKLGVETDAKLWCFTWWKRRLVYYECLSYKCGIWY